MAKANDKGRESVVSATGGAGISDAPFYTANDSEVTIFWDRVPSGKEPLLRKILGQNVGAEKQEFEFDDFSAGMIPPAGASRAVDTTLAEVREFMIRPAGASRAINTTLAEVRELCTLIPEVRTNVREHYIRLAMIGGVTEEKVRILQEFPSKDKLTQEEIERGLHSAVWNAGAVQAVQECFPDAAARVSSTCIGRVLKFAKDTETVQALRSFPNAKDVSREDIQEALSSAVENVGMVQALSQFPNAQEVDLESILGRRPSSQVIEALREYFPDAAAKVSAEFLGERIGTAQPAQLQSWSQFPNACNIQPDAIRIALIGAGAETVVALRTHYVVARSLPPGRLVSSIPFVRDEAAVRELLQFPEASNISEADFASTAGKVLGVDRLMERKEIWEQMAATATAAAGGGSSIPLTTVSGGPGHIPPAPRPTTPEK